VSIALWTAHYAGALPFPYLQAPLGLGLIGFVSGKLG
jgi:hypothetical protein